MQARTKQIYRDACRRSHRIMAGYLALWAWKKRVDCVVLDRSEVLSYLGLDVMRELRLQWLATDIKDLFPHTKPLYWSKSGVYASLYLSRLKFPSGAFDSNMHDDERINLLRQKGLQAASANLQTESRMIHFLASTAVGVNTRKRKAVR